MTEFDSDSNTENTKDRDHTSYLAGSTYKHKNYQHK